METTRLTTLFKAMLDRVLETGFEGYGLLNFRVEGHNSGIVVALTICFIRASPT